MDIRAHFILKIRSNLKLIKHWKQPNSIDFKLESKNESEITDHESWKKRKNTIDKLTKSRKYEETKEGLRNEERGRKKGNNKRKQKEEVR